MALSMIRSKSMFNVIKKLKNKLPNELIEGKFQDRLFIKTTAGTVRVFSAVALLNNSKDIDRFYPNTTAWQR